MEQVIEATDDEPADSNEVVEENQQQPEESPSEEVEKSSPPKRSEEPPKVLNAPGHENAESKNPNIDISPFANGNDDDKSRDE